MTFDPFGDFATRGYLRNVRDVVLDDVGFAGPRLRRIGPHAAARKGAEP